MLLAKAFKEAVWAARGTKETPFEPPIERVKDALKDLRDDILEWAGFEIEGDGDITLQAIGVEFALRCLALLSPGAPETATGTKDRFISIYAEGGLINRVDLFNDLDLAINNMRESLRDPFDPDTDDARIFKVVPGEVYAEQVYSYE